MRVRVTTLGNGVRVAAASMPSAESVALGIWVGVGGRHESLESAGASHFLEHLLFKGTASRSARDIAQAVEGRGGYLDAFTQEENTCYFVKVPHEVLEPAADVLADMVLHPRLAPSDIRTERDVIREEIRMYEDDPEHGAEEMLAHCMWQDHPLGRSLVGRASGLRRLTRSRLRAFHARHYVPASTILVGAGRLDPTRLTAVARRLLGGTPPRPRPGFIRVSGATGQTRFGVRDRDTEQIYLTLGVRVFGRRDPRRHVLRILSVVLGENASSRLFQTVREERGLAYAIHSAVHLFDDTGGFVVAAGMDAGRTATGVSLVVRELERLRAERVGPDELQRAKDYALGQMRLGLESTTNRMMWIGEGLAALDRVVQPAEVRRAIEAVTADEIRALARAVLRGRRMSCVMIGPRLPRGEQARIERAITEGV